jgi:hypothetical protein
MFGAIGLAVLSGLGRRQIHPGIRLHLPVVIDLPIKEQQRRAWVVAPGRTIDADIFLPMPSTTQNPRALPSYRMVLKLACGISPARSPGPGSPPR